MILNISITHKEGIDKGLIIVSELHSAERVESDISLQMKNGIRVVMMAHVVNDHNVYGPSFLVEINGKIFDRNDDLLYKFSNASDPVAIGDKKLFTYQDNKDQLLEILISPEL